MFLKSCKGRKSCLDPIPNSSMIFKNSQQHFFSCFHLCIIIDEIFPRHNPTFFQHFSSIEIVNCIFKAGNHMVCILIFQSPVMQAVEISGKE